MIATAIDDGNSDQFMRKIEDGVIWLLLVADLSRMYWAGMLMYQQSTTTQEGNLKGRNLK